MSDPTPHLLVGSASNTGYFTGTSTVDLQTLGGWQIKSLAQDPRGVLWCVGSQGNPGIWNPGNQTWTSTPDLLGGWSFNSLAWDPTGSLWCVGSAGNLSRWQGEWASNSGAWTGAENGFPQMRSTVPWKMVTFAPNGTMWGVQGDGAIVSWDPDLNQWEPLGNAPAAETLMVSFSDAMYAVTADFRTFRSENMTVPQDWTQVPTGWTVRWFGPAGHPGVNLPSGA